MTMRVLLLSTWFPDPPNNGSKLRAYHLLQALKHASHVTLISFRPDDTQARTNLDDENVPIHAVAEDPFRYTQLPRAVKYLSPTPLAYWQIQAMSRTVRRVSAKADWDAVVALQMPAARYALEVNAAARVLDVDTSLSYWAFDSLGGKSEAFSRWRGWVSWQKSYMYEKRLLSRFALGTLVSPVEMSYLRGMVGANGVALEVLPNGVDCVHNRPGIAQPKPAALVFNGSLTYSANYDAMRWFLAEIYPRIKAQVPGVSLTITGSTRGVDLGGLALDESVRLTGFVDDVRIPVAEAAACVVPIRQGGGTRLKILEAMALGTPVIATRKGAEGLDVVDGEHLLVADDPETFASRTRELLFGRDLRMRLTANARHLVEIRYDWQGIGRSFIHLLEEAVAKRKLTGKADDKSS